jgi:hypothetical protein
MRRLYPLFAPIAVAATALAQAGVAGAAARKSPATDGVAKSAAGQVLVDGRGLARELTELGALWYVLSSARRESPGGARRRAGRSRPVA